MFRLGVYRLDQYPPAWFRRDHVDYRLLRASAPPTPSEIAAFEGITRGLQLRGGVFRTSLPGRFRELDDWSNPLLRKHFGSGVDLLVEDWAAADCITSVEWHTTLQQAFPTVRIVASDLNLYLIAIDGPDAGCFVVEPGNGLLQYIQPPFVVRVHPPEPPRLPVNRWLANRAAARFEMIRQRLGIDPVQVEFPAGCDQISHPPYRFTRIPLVHPRATDLALNASSFEIKRHSVLEPAPRPSHLIRTMNVLNLGYFDPATIEHAARCVWDSLLPGGAWIVGRSVNYEPPLHHASLLVKTPRGFEVLDRHVDKSEVEHLALKVHA